MPGSRPQYIRDMSIPDQRSIHPIGSGLRFLHRDHAFQLVLWHTRTRTIWKKVHSDPSIPAPGEQARLAGQRARILTNKVKSKFPKK